MITNYNPYKRLECETGRFLQFLPDLVKPEEVLVIAPKHNQGDRHDATGAFHLGARDFCLEHGLSTSKTIFLFDNHITSRYRLVDTVLAELRRVRPKVLIDFSHGYQHAVQCGLRCPNHPGATTEDRKRWNEFNDLLTCHVGDGFASPVVLWYACSTGDDPDGDPDTAPGSGDGSFADMQRDALCERWATQCRVLSHTTAGHAWRNKKVKLFDGLGKSDGGVGAELVAIDGDDPGESRLEEERKLEGLLLTPWVWTFPFKSLTAVRAELGC